MKALYITTNDGKSYEFTPKNVRHAVLVNDETGEQVTNLFCTYTGLDTAIRQYHAQNHTAPKDFGACIVNTDIGRSTIITALKEECNKKDAIISELREANEARQKTIDILCKTVQTQREMINNPAQKDKYTEIRITGIKKMDGKDVAVLETTYDIRQDDSFTAGIGTEVKMKVDSGAVVGTTTLDRITVEIRPKNEPQKENVRRCDSCRIPKGSLGCKFLCGSRYPWKN